MSSDLDAIRAHIDSRFQETKDLMSEGHAAVRAEVKAVSDRVENLEREAKSIRKGVDRVTEEVYVGREGREPLKQIVAMNRKDIDQIHRRKSPKPPPIEQYAPIRPQMASETSVVQGQQVDPKEAGKLVAKALGLVALAVGALVAGFYALLEVVKAAGK